MAEYEAGPCLGWYPYWGTPRQRHCLINQATTNKDVVAPFMGQDKGLINQATTERDVVAPFMGQRGQRR